MLRLQLETSPKGRRAPWITRWAYLWGHLPRPWLPPSHQTPSRDHALCFLYLCPGLHEEGSWSPAVVAWRVQAWTGMYGQAAALSQCGPQDLSEPGVPSAAPLPS